jgi:hypothetical protein
MAAKTYTIRQTAWDGQPGPNFRLIHQNNQVTVTDPLFQQSKVDWTPHLGTNCSPQAQTLWEGGNGSKWRRGTKTVNGTKVRIYIKRGIMLDSQNEGQATEHMLVMLAVDQNLFGSLIDIDDNGHTGQWR